MKNLLLLIALFFVFSLSGQEIMYPEGLPVPNVEELKKSIKEKPEIDFFSFYQETMNLNKDRFENLDSIKVGDTILLPVYPKGIKKVVAKEPLNNNYDCIWKISENELLKIKKNHNTDTTINAGVSTMSNFIGKNESIQENNCSDKKFNFLLALLILILIILIFNSISFVLIPNWYKKWKHHLKYPVLIQDLRMLSSEERLNFFQKYLNKDEKINYIEFGFLKRHFGNKFLKVKLEFADKNRFVYLNENDLICKLIINKGNSNCRSEFFTTHGGLRIISPETEMTIPANWYFKPDFPKENKECNSNIVLIETLSSINDKRNNILKKEKEKKKKKHLQYEELDQIIEVIKKCQHLKYDIDYHDNYGDWNLKLKIKPKTKK